MPDQRHAPSPHSLPCGQFWAWKYARQRKHNYAYREPILRTAAQAKRPPRILTVASAGYKPQAVGGPCECLLREMSTRPHRADRSAPPRQRGTPWKNARQESPNTEKPHSVDQRAAARFEGVRASVAGRPRLCACQGAVVVGWRVSRRASRAVLSAGACAGSAAAVGLFGPVRGGRWVIVVGFVLSGTFAHCRRA